MIRWRIRAVLCLFALPCRAGAAAAQEPVTADSAVVADSARAEEPATVPRDSIMKRLLELEGYNVTEYQGAAARFNADDDRVVLVGEASMTRAGQSMTADSLLVFDQATDVVCGYGQPVLSGRGAPVESQQVCYDIERRLGVAEGADTEFRQRTTWFVHGERIYTRGSERLYGRHTNFTSCSLETPHYHFSAGKVKIVQEDVLVAKDVTLNFGDVPVFWLPFMFKSLEEGRRSGLLMPRFGINDIVRRDDGYERHISNIGFYWAINDYMGAKLALDWFSDNWTAVTGSFDYNWNRQFLRGGINFSRYWREDGSKELTLRTFSSWRPGENTSVRVSGNYASSSRFIRRDSFDPERLRRELTSSAGIDHSFNWGGSLSVSARRSQSLLREEVTRTLPQFSLSLPSITLFDAPADEASWYNNISWRGGMRFQARRRMVPDTIADARDRSSRSASAQSSINVGRFSLGGNIDFDQEVLGRKPMRLDTLGDTISAALPSALRRELRWSANISYTQDLIGMTTLSPNISINGRLLQTDSTGRLVAAPVRFDFGASLRTTIFGFWPGVGPFSKIRHSISPSISYSYSPGRRREDLSPVQREVFNVRDVRERNQVRISINNVVEAKYEESDTVSAAAPADSAAQAEAAVDGGDPRRLPQTPKVKLLSLTTSAFNYDFVQAREGADIGRDGIVAGLVTEQVRNTIRSELLPDLSVTMVHDLFRERSFRALGLEYSPRDFAPHLTSVRARLSLDAESWLVEMLGLSGGEPAPDSAAAGAEEERLEGPDGEREYTGADDMMTTGPRQRQRFAPSGSAGSWRASLNYSLVRPRAGFGRENQVVDLQLSFQPTEKWSVNWNTGYSITAGEFSSHYLTLTRDLHRWRANFSFVKAQNGNFSFRFFVQLRDNRDLKFDYQQRGRSLFDEDEE